MPESAPPPQVSFQPNQAQPAHQTRPAHYGENAQPHQQPYVPPQQQAPQFTPIPPQSPVPAYSPQGPVPAYAPQSPVPPYPPQQQFQQPVQQPVQQQPYQQQPWGQPPQQQPLPQPQLQPQQQFHPQFQQQPYGPPPVPQFPAQAPPQFPVPQPPQFPMQGQPQLPPPGQSPAMDFPPPPNLAPPRDNFLNGAGPFLEPGEQLYYGFILKLDDTIEETPRELMIAIEGQHHTLGEIDRASRKINRAMKWVNPMEAAADLLAEKGVEALNRKLAGPVFVGGWMSQAGWFIRFVRATREDYGPGAYGALTSRRYLVFRAARVGGSAMRLVYAVPRTTIAGVRLEGSKDALLHGRTPRAELHFTDGSMVATMMPTKSGEQVASILQTQTQMQMQMQTQGRY